MNTLTVKNKEGMVIYVTHLEGCRQHISNISFDKARESLIVQIDGCQEVLVLPGGSSITFDLE